MRLVGKTHDFRIPLTHLIL